MIPEINHARWADHARSLANLNQITAANVGELAGMDFIFICIDDGPSKKVLSDFLAAQGKTFIDVGLGVHEKDGKLFGVVRVTTSSPE